MCTSPNGKTWQATDLGQGGNAPTSGHRIVVAVTPAGQTVALWGYNPLCINCSIDLEAAVHPAGGNWGAPVTLSTNLGSTGGLVLGTDGSGNVIAGWVAGPGDTTDAVLPAGSSSWDRPRRCRSKAAWARRTA